MKLLWGLLSSFASRSNDALITSKVKGRFMDGGKFQINHVKVITEDSVVYLLGIVNTDEAGARSTLPGRPREYARW